MGSTKAIMKIFANSLNLPVLHHTQIQLDQDVCMQLLLVLQDYGNTLRLNLPPSEELKLKIKKYILSYVKKADPEHMRSN